MIQCPSVLLIAPGGEASCFGTNDAVNSCVPTDPDQASVPVIQQGPSPKFDWAILASEPPP